MANLQTTLKLTLLENVTSRARAVNRSLEGIERHTRGLMALSRNMATFAAGYITLTAGVDKTYTAAQDLQAKFTEMGIKAGLSNERLAGMQRHLTALAPKVNQLTGDLATGVDTMLTMGLSADQAMGSIEAVAKTATATGASIDDLSSASVSAMQNLSIAPDQIKKMLDGMAYAGNAGAFELRNMAEYFPALTANAQALGIDGVDGAIDLASALQVARRGAGDASTAANNLGNFLGKIMSPEVRKNFKKFGVDLTKELKKAHKQGISPIEHFIRLVDEKTNGGQADLLGQLFGDKQVQDFVRPMLKDLKDYIKIRDGAMRADGTVDSAFAKRMEDNAQKTKAFRIAMENLGTAIGGTLLKPVADFAEAMTDALNTIDQRAGIFDDMSTSMKGFLNGLGFDGGVKEATKALADLLLGPADGSASADRLGRIFARFQEFGKEIREFSDAVRDNPITKFLGELSPFVWDALKISVGLAVLAGTVRKLASALLLLSGASTLIGVLKSLGALADVPGLNGKNPSGKTPGKTPDVPAVGWFGRFGTWLKGLGVQSTIGAIPQVLGDTPGDSFQDQLENQRKFQDGLRKLLGLKPWRDEYIPPRFIGPMRPDVLPDVEGYDMAARQAYANSPAGIAEAAANWGRRPMPMTGTDDHHGKKRDDFDMGRKVVTIDNASISALLRPSGVQDVRVTNSEKPQVNVHVGGISITGITDLASAASSAASQLGAKIKNAVESTHTD